MTAAISHVGEWQLKIHTGLIDGDQLHVAYEHEGYIFLLFNPWCEEDPVYLENEKDREEYVLQDTGAVWQGSSNGQASPCPWNFGQFEDVSLYAALLVLRLDKQMIEARERHDPVKTARALTHLVNRTVNYRALL